MTAVIWFVQVVHYPLMANVGPDHLQAYAIRNRELTTWIVLPLMLLELLSSSALLLAPLSTPHRITTWTGLALLGLIWSVTFFVSVPLHLQLSEGSSSEPLSMLVQSNWIRTAAWSTRALLSIWMLWSWSAASLSESSTVPTP